MSIYEIMESMERLRAKLPTQYDFSSGAIGKISSVTEKFTVPKAASLTSFNLDHLQGMHNAMTPTVAFQEGLRPWQSIHQEITRTAFLPMQILNPLNSIANEMEGFKKAMASIGTIYGYKRSDSVVEEVEINLSNDLKDLTQSEEKDWVNVFHINQILSQFNYIVSLAGDGGQLLYQELQILLERYVTKKNIKALTVTCVLDLVWDLIKDLIKDSIR